VRMWKSLQKLRRGDGLGRLLEEISTASASDPNWNSVRGVASIF